jgi:hypothetical protein
MYIKNKNSVLLLRIKYISFRNTLQRISHKPVWQNYPTKRNCVGVGAGIYATSDVGDRKKQTAFIWFYS